MKEIHPERWAVVKQGGQYVKPAIDDVPIILFKNKRDAIAYANNNPKWKAVKVRMTITPV